MERGGRLGAPRTHAPAGENGLVRVNSVPVTRCVAVPPVSSWEELSSSDGCQLRAGIQTARPGARRTLNLFEGRSVMIRRSFVERLETRQLGHASFLSQARELSLTRHLGDARELLVTQLDLTTLLGVQRDQLALRE